MLKGGWWWKSCGRGLNGLYLADPNDLTARQGKLRSGYVQPRPLNDVMLSGIVWFRWRGWDYSLKRSTMMIRPKKFLDGTEDAGGGSGSGGGAKDEEKKS